MNEGVEPSYEEKVAILDEILERLDHAVTPIYKLAEDVKLGARLIKELDAKLKQVEMMRSGNWKPNDGDGWRKRGSVCGGKWLPAPRSSARTKKVITPA
ncbi:MAG: exodeoxyribonuclease VII small subunit [Verrucomicrobiota bacterium]